MNTIANSDFSEEQAPVPAVKAAVPVVEPQLNHISEEEYRAAQGFKMASQEDVVDAELVNDPRAIKDPSVYSYGDFGKMAMDVHDYYSGRLDSTSDENQKKDLTAQRETALSSIYQAGKALKATHPDQYIQTRKSLLGELKIQEVFSDPELQRIIEIEEQREITQARVQQMTQAQMLVELLAGSLNSLFGRKSMAGTAFRDTFSESVFRGNLADAKLLSQGLANKAGDSQWMAENGKNIADNLQRKMASIDNAIKSNPQNFANNQDVRDAVNGIKANIKTAHDKAEDKAMLKQLQESIEKMLDAIMKMFNRKKMAPGA